ncbi:hypothetical protein E2C01_041577 [Portunus trituberculatus]|uniref:Uncharacterized protein n=1 Tax=Portunus trituberculatus TaxID=210409 RepID=A0A5B7FR33_PORTR|nr:hypothetical protein [Portunus trituberculatus]
MRHQRPTIYDAYLNCVCSWLLCNPRRPKNAWCSSVSAAALIIAGKHYSDTSKAQEERCIVFTDGNNKQKRSTLSDAPKDIIVGQQSAARASPHGTAYNYWAIIRETRPGRAEDSTHRPRASPPTGTLLLRISARGEEPDRCRTMNHRPPLISQSSNPRIRESGEH